MASERASGQLWAVVAATAGVSPPPARANGPSDHEPPAPYLALPDQPASPLQKALHRAVAIAERRHIVALVAAEHRRWWQDALWFVPPANVITHHERLGSALGLLVAALRILERDPDASIVLLPATQRARDERVLTHWIGRGATLAALRSPLLVLLGIERERRDAARACVVAGPYDGRGGFEVARLVEARAPIAPDEPPAGDRVLWNSGIVAGSGLAFLELFRRHAPDLIVETRSARYTVDLPRLVDRLMGLDFRRHLLPGQEASIRVLAVPRCGWLDVGDGALPRLLSRKGEIDVTRAGARALSVRARPRS